MVSRTSRQYQSQPRPRTTGRPSLEPWEGVNENLRSQPPPANGRPSRAQSSMRYASNGRSSLGSRPTPRMDIPQKMNMNGNGNGSARPRPVSAGRVRPAPNQPLPQQQQQPQQQHHAPQESVDNPMEMARQIMDLRERRESSAHTKRRSLDPQQSRPTASNGGVGIQQSKSNLSSNEQRPASPQGRVLQRAGSSMSKEEIAAEERLKKAENKISGLLDELEELKFFQELESETPSAAIPKTPSRSTSNLRNVNFSSRNNHPVPQNANQSVPRERAPSRSREPDRVTSRGRETDRTAGIPLNIRAVSPARAGGRLPPPPPVTVGGATPRSAPMNTPMARHVAKNGNAGGLETYKPLSPRSIAKLDRNSLELECQTLVRKLQIIEQDRNSQAAMVEMYEISLQDSDVDKQKIQHLQGELGKVSGELKRQLQSISKGKEALVREYEDKLQNNLAKLHRVQEKVDSYKMDLEVTQEEAKRAKQETESLRNQAREERARAEQSKARESTLQAQLQETRDMNASLVKKLEQKQNELAGLQNELGQASEQMRDQEMARNDEYETQIEELQSELSQAQDRCARIEQNFRDRDEQASGYEKQLDMAQVREAEQTQLIEELEHRVESLEKETVVKFEEGKKASKSAETRKMQELVAERANQTREYERRIKAMQEQLRHQADRHHAEVQESRRRNDERLESMREEIREELQMQEGEKMLKLETELSVLRRTYEEAKEDYAGRLKEAQQKSRDTAVEFQRQDEIRQQELNNLQNRVATLGSQVASKEEEIGDLKKRLEDTRKALEEMDVAKSKVLEELAKKDDLLDSERDKMKDREMESIAQMDAVKAVFSELESRLRDENHNLQEHIDEMQKKLITLGAEAKEGKETQERLEEVQTALAAAESSLLDEKTRREEVEGDLKVELAKMEGKLRASESSLNSKKARVVELEKQLDDATATSSKAGEKKQEEIESLRKEIEKISQQLNTERWQRESKEAEVSQLEAEISSLQEKVRSMNRLEDTVIEMKRQAAEVGDELKQKNAKLEEVTKSLEQTKSKLQCAQDQSVSLKSELETQASKKDRLVERYEKSIKDLECKLQKEHDSLADLEISNSELKRNIDSLEREKVRKETELENLRKDYDDLSGLLEENLHSSAKKDELDAQLKRREREMQETVDTYNQNVMGLEEKLSQSEKAKEKLEAKVKKLQMNLDDLNDEKLKLRSDASSLRQKYDDVCYELETMRDQQQQWKGGAEQDRNNRHMREAIQRYTRTIADLESKLEEEASSKVELEDRLSSARSELEDKQKYTEELLQKQSKATRQLETDLNNIKYEKEELESKLDQTTKDLEQKRRELKQAVSKFSTEVSELHSVKQEHQEYRQMSESTREELERKTKQIDELEEKVSQLQSDFQSKSRECDEARASAKRYESELKKRKEQYDSVISRYNDQIAALEKQLDSRSPGQDENSRAEAKSKDAKIRELQDAITELETKLEIANKNRESAKMKAETYARELDEKESDARRFEMEKIELETKLQSQMRSKEELRSKVSELSSKVERKEREVREATDRYKMYVMELETKLDKDTDTKHQMQLDIDRLKNDLNSALEVSNEAAELREKVYSLETEVENYRSKARDVDFKSKETNRSLENQLAQAEKARDDLEETLKKTQGEKAEVIAALEGVINEVQNREDEIESLSELLHRRDEELQHAKIIATKALQSAKDIQKRFKDRDKGQQSELMQRMDELTENVETLSSKNETLQRKIGMLERDLREKNFECKRLKDQLRQFDQGAHREARNDYGKDDGSAFTQSTYSSSRVEGSRAGLRITSAASVDPDGIGMGCDSFSPGRGGSPAQEFGDENIFRKELEFPAFERKPSDLSDGAGASTIHSVDAGSHSRWSHDFDNDNRSNGFESYSSEPVGKSRKSIEKDALRKYVRQRYMSKR